MTAKPKRDADDDTDRHVLGDAPRAAASSKHDDRAPAYSDTRELRPRISVSQLVGLLREVSLFASLSDRELEELASSATVAEYEKDDSIVHQGDPGGSLLVIESGFVELLLERSGAEPVPLASYGRGDFFGELSLFDCKPRSATARATTQCRIVEVRRESVMAKLSLPMMTCLLAAVAARVRKTDVTVSTLTDRVGRAAIGSAHAAVAVELDAVKTLYQRTEHLAADTLERAELRGAAILERAEAAAARVDARFDAERAKLQKIAKYAAWALGLFGLGGIGWLTAVFKAGEDVRAKADESKAASVEIMRIGRSVTALDRSLRVVKETTSDLRAMEEAAGLGRPVQSPPELKRIAQNYELAKQAVRSRYLERASDSRFEPEVVLDAALKYMTLVSESRGDKQLFLSEPERLALNNALLHVLENLAPSRPEAGELGEARWMFERKLRDTWGWLQITLSEGERAVLRERLADVMRDPQLYGQPTRENAALVFTALGRSKQSRAANHQLAIGLLRSAMSGAGPPRVRPSWISVQSALALSWWGEKSAWQALEASLERPQTQFMAAAALAEEGPEKLMRLAALGGSKPGLLLDRINALLDLQVKDAPNCFEQRYARWLLGCLGGDCPTAAKAGEVGGSCIDEP